MASSLTKCYPRRFVLLVIILIAGHRLSIAQVQKVDSLKNEIKKADHDTTRIALMLSVAYNLWAIAPAEMPEYLNQAAELLKKTRYPLGEGRLNNIRGIYYWTQGDYRNAIEHYNKAYDIYQTNGLLKRAALTTINIGLFHSDLGSYDNALLIFNRALAELNKLQGAENDIAEVHNNIGAVYKNLNELEKALDHYTIYLNYATSRHDSLAIAAAYSNIGDVYLIKEEIEKALINQHTALSIYSKHGYSYGVSTTYYQLGRCYLAKKDCDMAIPHLKNAYGLAQTANLNRLYIPILNALGECYMLSKQPQEAIMYYESALQYQNTSKKIDFLATLKGLAKAYSEVSQHENAYTKLVLATQISDSIYNDEKRKRILQAEIDHKLIKKNEEILSIRKDQEIKTLAQYLVILGLIFVLTTVMLIINRQKKQQIITRKERELLEAELQKEQLRKENLTKEIELKSKELTNFTLNLIQKNNFLFELKEQISEIRNVVNEEQASRLNSVLKRINQSFRLDKDWDTFERHFEYVNEKFFEKLRTNFPELTTQELKHCAMIKLGLSNKEIASIAGISAESVKVARSRLRKKLSIETDKNITHFLAHFSD